MATLILVRHGRTTANASGILAGRSPGVTLDETGRDQAAQTGERLAAVGLAALVSSPLERCRATAQAVTDAHPAAPELDVDDRLTECDYGDWQGRSLKELAAEDLWRTVQHQPSAARFPDGESLREMSDRAVAAVRERDARLHAAHGAHAVWVAVSHGDIIKAVLADASGAHLDHFQRFVVDPGSVSIVRYTAERPFVLAMNTRGGDLAWLDHRPETPEGDAVVGGGAGS